MDKCPQLISKGNRTRTLSTALTVGCYHGPAAVNNTFTDI